MSNIKEKTMQFRVSESEKDEIERHASIMGTTTSKFLRELAVSPDKIIVLEKGQEIAAALSGLLIEVNNAIRLQKTDNLSEELLLNKLYNISAMFAEIIDTVTVFKTKEGDIDVNS